MKKSLKVVNDVIAFLVEIALLTALVDACFHFTGNKAAQYLLAIFLPSVFAILWGIFAAPRSRRRLKPLPLAFFKLVLFSIGIFLLFKSGHTVLAACFGIIAFINLLIGYLLENQKPS